MVGDWSPDPPREADDQLTNSSHAVFFESEDSEEETYTSPPIGYELLFAPSTGLTSDEVNNLELYMILVINRYTIYTNFSYSIVTIIVI